MRKIRIIFLARQRQISLMMLGVVIIFGVLLYQHSKQNQISEELGQMQEKFNDQETSISTVVRVLDEIREEKKEVQRESKQIRDSLAQAKEQASALEHMKDSLMHVNRKLQNEIKAMSVDDALSPLEQRYRSRSKQNPG